MKCLNKQVCYYVTKDAYAGHIPLNGRHKMKHTNFCMYKTLTKLSLSSYNLQSKILKPLISIYKRT